jgi:uncharacterized membrane protein YphA (DoxX/SURF4 family)
VYLIFALPAGTTVRPGSLGVWIHNVAVLAIGAQLAILYFTSGFMKLNGYTWHHGTALYLISQVEWFSLPSTRDWFKDPTLVTIASYATMVFQVWFPIAIVSPLRRLFVAVGIAFHIGIAITMGLVTFSTIMIGLELFLLRDADFERLRAWRAGSAERIRQRLHTRFAPATSCSTVDRVSAEHRSRTGFTG